MLVMGPERKKPGWPTRAAAMGGKRRKVSLMTAREVGNPMGRRIGPLGLTWKS